jgi:hypothetical protein
MISARCTILRETPRVMMIADDGFLYIVYKLEESRSEVVRDADGYVIVGATANFYGQK